MADLPLNFNSNDFYIIDWSLEPINFKTDFTFVEAIKCAKQNHSRKLPQKT